MLSNIRKRIILIIFDLWFSYYIWTVNASWGNTFQTCLNLSISTFLVVFIPFEIYWRFRDIWSDRWKKIPTEKLKGISKVEVAIKVEGGYISADIIKPMDRVKMEKRNTIIIVSPGFSDIKESIQYYYYPFIFQGYIVIVYDARGTGESKKAGRRSQFLKRIDDFKNILEWIKEDEFLKHMKLNCVGFSIGAITVLCGGFRNKNINKIIAISSMSKYRQNLPKYNFIVMFSYFIKGVKLFPNDQENKKLSPYVEFERLKKELSDNEWKWFSERVMLIHSKNDRVIKFKNLNENKSILETLPENLLILKKGGHSHKKNELALVGASLNFFNN